MSMKRERVECVPWLRLRKRAPPFEDAEHELNDREERERDELPSTIADTTPPLPPSTEHDTNEMFPINCDVDRLVNSNTPPFPVDRRMFDITLNVDWILPELRLTIGAVCVINESDVMFI